LSVILSLYILLHLITAEITTEKGKARIDASKGKGELETNDVNYAYKYLIMPENIMDIHEAVRRMAKRLDTGHAVYYDPTLTNNN
jgi:hypothetical protein